MTSKKVSISLPENLLKRVDDLSRQLNVTRSELITRILEEKMGMLTTEKPPRYPTVLWKLSLGNNLRLRSPRLPGRTVGGRWVLEEVKPP